uniref:(northern house mosquito) hypothetical protein n=1 Tax=Culex pipiens TaxID=7175 RepID=A0A8D8IMB1_CULPI
MRTYLLLGLPRPLHGLLTILPTLHGPPNRAVPTPSPTDAQPPKPPRNSSRLQPNSDLTLQTQGHRLRRTSHATVHPGSVRKAPTSGTGPRANSPRVHLHDGLPLSPVPPLRVRTPLQADGPTGHRKRRTTVRNRPPPSRSSTVRRVRHHAGHPGLRSAR